MSVPGVLARNEDELLAIRQIAGSKRDGPVLMLNVNRYYSGSGFPHEAPYTEYIAGLERLVCSLGGRIMRRLPVLGQPVGQSPHAHEVLEIWYPNHQVYLDLPTAPGGERNYELRKRCVEVAVIHRCPGDILERPSPGSPAD